MNNKSEIQILQETVIDGGFCIGCGSCTSVPGSPFKVVLNKYGNYVAELDSDRFEDANVKLLDVCPFSGKSKNEEELSEVFFPEIVNRDVKIGKFEQCYAGYVEEGDFRKRGSSGGVAKWLGYQLLEQDEIDFFVQLVPNATNNPNKPLFDYDFFSKSSDVIKGSKSSYYPVTLDNVIQRIRNTEGRYAVTGVPCFIKTLRILADKEEILRDRIKFTIGIVCGGMKSANQSKMIGWQLGVLPENLIAIDFRRKYSDRPASQKIYQVWSNLDSKERFENANSIYGTDYGAGLFKPKACDYCDDVVGETADISIGDAWLPQFRSDPDGTSLIIIRNKVINKIFQSSMEESKLKLFSISSEEAGNSQDGGFRHRREGLSFRLSKLKNSGEWYPEKRIKENSFVLSENRKLIYSLREEISNVSHHAFVKAMDEQDLTLFHNEMDPLLKRYDIALHGSKLKQTRNRIVRRLKNILGL